jgi:hypothetical protein
MLALQASSSSGYGASCPPIASWLRAIPTQGIDSTLIMDGDLGVLIADSDLDMLAIMVILDDIRILCASVIDISSIALALVLVCRDRIKTSQCTEGFSVGCSLM